MPSDQSLYGRGCCLGHNLSLCRYWHGGPLQFLLPRRHVCSPRLYLLYTIQHYDFLVNSRYSIHTYGIFNLTKLHDKA
jgi:hypothetical protein